MPAVAAWNFVLVECWCVESGAVTSVSCSAEEGAARQVVIPEVI